MSYKPGAEAPYTGTIQCVEHPETQDHIDAGETLPPCAHWGDKDRKNCSWQYISKD